MRFAAAGIAVLVLALTGCAGSSADIPGFSSGSDTTTTTSSAPVTSAPTSATPSPTASATDAAPDSTTCGDAQLVVSVKNSTVTIDGDCPDLLVRGDGITLTAETVGNLEIEGVGNIVNAASIGPVSISGQGNSVTGDPIDTVTISGDGNDVISDSTVTGGSITGNDNEISAPGGIGAVTDNGAGNVYGN